VKLNVLPACSVAVYSVTPSWCGAEADNSLQVQEFAKDCSSLWNFSCIQASFVLSVPKLFPAIFLIFT
jgi:hypothetical protein